MTTEVTTPPDPASVPAAAPTPGPVQRASTAIGTYRPGLDGMRGLAMLCMLGYHGEVAWCRGAFLALSQFFTLSGFLITGVLLRNHLQPGGEMKSFWSRRMRRLMPAAILALFGVVLFGATVATRQQADALPGDVFAAATWTANWHFVLSGQSYLNLFAAPSPVQHFWSLAIEEQFYLVLPVVLIFVVRRTRSLRVMLAVVCTAALLSTLWMAALYQGGASLDRLYYGTDTRMAELLVGAALAVVLFRTGVEFSERMRRIFGVVGLVCFAATLWCWSNISLADGPIWRGGFLAYSFLSCGVILGVLAGKAPLNQILSFRPIVYVGRISYGLYLFHWPVYLWLDQARTGLDGWALLALRIAVTFALAILSFRFVERPIMRGHTFGLRGRALLLIVPCALVLVVVLGFVTVNTSGADPLATLRAQTAQPRIAGDGVLDVLVVPPAADDPVVDRLRDSVRGDASVKLTVAPPFRCDGGLVDTPGGRTCANWAQTWPALIARTDPDAVVLFADDWAGDDIPTLTGRPPAESAAAVQPVLDAGLDLLAAKGAPVIWGSSGSSFGVAVQRSLRPFSQAMTQLRSTRSDLFKVVGTEMPDPATVSRPQYLDQSAKALLDDASLYQRRTAGGLPRVMVVGDSQSESLGYGLERWTAEHNRAQVWNRGAEGCGVVVAGSIHTFGSTGSGMEKCRAASAAWTPDLRSFDPAAVVVLTSITDVQERKIPGSDTFSSIGDPKFDRFLVRQYEQVVDTLSATGAKVIWMKPPCAVIPSGLGQKAPYDSSQVEHLNSVILPQVERARAGKVTMFDLDGVICPGGKARESVPGVGALRPDGVHFSVPGALWIARTAGDRLLKAAGI